MNDNWGRILKLKIAIHALAVAVIRSASSADLSTLQEKPRLNRNLQNAATGEMASCLTPPIIF